MLRAVLDTNVVLAANRSTHPLSPNAEIVTRWMAGEFVWLVSDDVVTEYAQKLLEKGIDSLKVERFVADLLQYAEEVPIRFYHFQHYPLDMMMWLFCCSRSMGRRPIWRPTTSI